MPLIVAIKWLTGHAVCRATLLAPLLSICQGKCLLATHIMLKQPGDLDTS